jgi:hypothetical protein
MDLINGMPCERSLGSDSIYEGQFIRRDLWVGVGFAPSELAEHRSAAGSI